MRTPRKVKVEMRAIEAGLVANFKADGGLSDCDGTLIPRPTVDDWVNAVEFSLMEGDSNLDPDDVMYAVTELAFSLFDYFKTERDVK